MTHAGLSQLINLVFEAYFLLILVRVIGSWLPPRPGQTTWSMVYGWCYVLTEPLLRPIRRALERFTGRIGLDLSPLVLWFLLALVRRVLLQWVIPW